MNAMRLAVGTLSSSSPRKPVRWRWPRCGAARGRQVFARRIRLSTAYSCQPRKERTPTPFAPDDRLQQASSVIVPGSDPAAPTPGQQPSTAPSITKSQDDGLDGCCRPFCNNPCPSIYGQVEALFMKQDPDSFASRSSSTPDHPKHDVPVNLGSRFQLRCPACRQRLACALCEAWRWNSRISASFRETRPRLP